MAGDGVAWDGGQVGQVLHQAPEGDVLAVGNPVDLVVAGHDDAAGGPRQGGVGEVVGAGVFDDPSHDGGVEAAGHLGDEPGLGRALDPVDVDHVLGPDDKVDGRLHERARSQLGFEDGGGVAVDRPQPALAAALDGGDGEAARAVGAVGHASTHDGGDDEDEGHARVHEVAARGSHDGHGDGADEGHDQQLPAQAGGRRQRPPDLSERQPGQGDAAEREVVAHVLGQDEGSGHSPQPPPGHGHGCDPILLRIPHGHLRA